MENSFQSIIDQSKSVLILLSSNPDFDEVSAGLSLYLVLQGRKDANIVSQSPITVEFNRLVGINKISEDLGNKNLIIKFADYKASDIERVSYDIEDGQFKLTVIPKQGMTAPQKSQIDFSYAGVSSDTVVLIGGDSESDFPALSAQDMAGVKIVHVGTKELSHDPQKQIMSFTGKTSTVSELVSAILKQNGLPIDSDIATNLLMGIEEGSNRFSTSGVTASTFQIFSELLRAGGQRMAQKPLRASDYPPGSIPGDQPRQAFTEADEEKKVDRKDDSKKDEAQKAPKDWLEPKIYKGTSTN